MSSKFCVKSKREAQMWATSDVEKRWQTLGGGGGLSELGAEQNEGPQIYKV